MRRGRYYLGRVIKLGLLDQKKLMDAIAEASTLYIGKFAWTITDVVDKRNDSELPFVFGKLSKFAKEGHVLVIDINSRSQKDATAENLLISSAPFIYLPQYSGIAYLHVWNGIEEEVFSRRFKSIIEATYKSFFVDCNIEPVADYRAFSAKLRELDLISEIYAKVYPPNPLFGRLWGSLKEYLNKRNATELISQESNKNGKGINTNVPDLMENILQNPKFESTTQPDITDAALLMAADGYGHGKVIGKTKGSDVVIRTSETQKSFLFAKEPLPDALARESSFHFSRISKERDMGH